MRVGPARRLNFQLIQFWSDWFQHKHTSDSNVARMLLTDQRGVPRLEHAVRRMQQTLPIAGGHRFFELPKRARVGDQEWTTACTRKALEMSVTAE